MRILLVEDDQLLGSGIQDALRMSDYTVDWVCDGKSALHAILTDPFDLVVLDLGLPRFDGMEVLKRCRSKGNSTPILILTARDAINERIAGLDFGADDYVLKPFDTEELKARIRAVVRRHHHQVENKIRHGALILDIGSHQVIYDDKEIKLTRHEFALLLDLIQHAGMARTHEQLEAVLYGWQDEVESNTIEVYIHHLRKKISSKLIRNLRGIGYIVDKIPSK